MARATRAIHSDLDAMCDMELFHPWPSYWVEGTTSPPLDPWKGDSAPSLTSSWYSCEHRLPQKTRRWTVLAMRFGVRALLGRSSPHHAQAPSGRGAGESTQQSIASTLDVVLSPQRKHSGISDSVGRARAGVTGRAWSVLT
jgi:hypothetical protein